MILNERQQEVVSHVHGPAMVLACPGSGKTRCLTERIINLIGNGVKPSNILAITFTNKAAMEMKNRLRSRVEGFDKMWVGTFHATCLRILKKWYELIGLKSNFNILDSSGQKSTVKRVLYSKGLTDKTKHDPDDYIKQIERKKNEFISDDVFKAYDATIWDVYQAYAKELLINNCVDFGGIIYLVVKLFKEHQDIANYYSKKFIYLMCDEVQDSSMCQFEFIRELTSVNNNVMMVGDQHQCIYGWRSARFANVADFIKDFSPKIIKVDQNFRSTKPIIDGAMSLIENNKSIEKVVAWTDRIGGENISYQSFFEPEDESEYIALKIRSYVSDGSNWSDNAILCRTNSMIHFLEEALRERDVPYQVIGAYGFFDRFEIKLVINYLKFVNNVNDTMAFTEAIQCPPRRVGHVAVTKLIEYTRSKDGNFYNVLKNASLIGLNKHVIGVVDEFVKVVDEFDVKDVAKSLNRLLSNMGVYDHFLEQDRKKNEYRLKNVRDFVASINSYFIKNSSSSLDTYLNTIMLADSSDVEEEDKVMLMTVHAAKGLEFKHVFIPGSEEDLFPHKRALMEGAIEEERRLYYVAMTRSEDTLNISSCKFRHGNQTVRSRFVEEVGL